MSRSPAPSSIPRSRMSRNGFIGAAAPTTEALLVQASGAAPGGVEARLDRSGEPEHRRALEQVRARPSRGARSGAAVRGNAAAPASPGTGTRAPTWTRPARSPRRRSRARRPGARPGARRGRTWPTPPRRSAPSRCPERRRTAPTSHAVLAPIEPSTGRSPPTLDSPRSIAWGTSVVTMYVHHVDGEPTPMTEEHLEVAHAALAHHGHLVDGRDAVRRLRGQPPRAGAPRCRARRGSRRTTAAERRSPRPGDDRSARRPRRTHCPRARARVPPGSPWCSRGTGARPPGRPRAAGPTRDRDRRPSAARAAPMSTRRSRARGSDPRAPATSGADDLQELRGRAGHRRGSGA